MSNSAPKSTERRMEYVEITQAEEMPVLSEQELAELMASLERSREQISRREGLRLKPDEIGPWLRATLDQAVQRRRDPSKSPSGNSFDLILSLSKDSPASSGTPPSTL